MFPLAGGGAAGVVDPAGAPPNRLVAGAGVAGAAAFGAPNEKPPDGAAGGAAAESAGFAAPKRFVLDVAGAAVFPNKPPVVPVGFAPNKLEDAGGGAEGVVEVLPPKEKPDLAAGVVDPAAGAAGVDPNPPNNSPPEAGAAAAPVLLAAGAVPPKLKAEELGAEEGDGLVTLEAVFVPPNNDVAGLGAFVPLAPNVNSPLGAAAAPPPPNKPPDAAPVPPVAAP